MTIIFSKSVLVSFYDQYMYTSVLIFTLGIECPSIGNSNTISTRSRVHHTVSMGSYCVISPGVLLVPTEDEILPDYTVVYGPSAERRTWSGRGKVQEADLRKKHADYLKETLPKFNRLRRGDGTWLMIFDSWHISLFIWAGYTSLCALPLPQTPNNWLFLEMCCFRNMTFLQHT